MSKETMQVFKLQLNVNFRSDLKNREIQRHRMTKGCAWVSAWVVLLGSLGPGRRNLPIAAVNACRRNVPKLTLRLCTGLAPKRLA